MRKKIFLFSCDPGGANTIIPLVRPLEIQGYKAMLFGKNNALKMYKKSDLNYCELSIQNSILYSELKKILNEIKPDFIITGTSSSDMTERYLWKISEELDVPSFAILDQWINYGIRFSKYAVKDKDSFYRNRKIEYLPTKILVMDEYAKKEAIQDGLDDFRIIVSGQPHLEAITKSIVKYQNTNKTVSKSTDFLITFASEPISYDYPDNYFGYSEKTIVAVILAALDKIVKNGVKVKFIIRPHPREEDTSYINVIKKYQSNYLDISVDKKSDSKWLISSSDLICGMSSMFLIEAAIFGKPILSIQIGLKKSNPFILDRKGIIKSILKRNHLKKILEKIILTRSYPKYNLDLVQNPINNVINNMKDLLCQN